LIDNVQAIAREERGWFLRLPALGVGCQWVGEARVGRQRRIQLRDTIAQQLRLIQKLCGLQSGESVSVWRLNPWSEVATATDSDWSAALAFSADDTRLFTAGLEGAVHAWDARTLAELPTLSGNPGRVWGMAPSSDGRLLATSSGRGIEVWDLATNSEVYAVGSTRADSPSNVAFSQDGSHLIGPAEAGNVSVYALGIDELLKIAHEHVTGGMTAEECQQYLHEATCPA
jgi:WD40 repeat protein